MTDDLSVVLLSNRGPISFVESDDEFTIKRGAGGLAGALDPVARRLGDRAVWIATATSKTDRKALAAGAADGLAEQLGYPVYMLDIEPGVYSRYYDLVSNRMLWFANHCLWDEVNIEGFSEEEIAAWDEAYEPVNERFARAVIEVAEPDSLVLFQDYHLSTAPAKLRARRPLLTIFHFTHSSFCGPEGLGRLPHPIPGRIIEGMLGADLIGFHVHAWCENFLACCEEIGAQVDRTEGTVDFKEQRSWVRAYPIPIDAPELEERARARKAQEWAERFRSNTSGQLIVRADRTEPSKNIVRGFKAFALLLDRRPDLRGQVRFVACLYPSRQSMDEYQAYIAEIEKTVDEINEKYPNSIELFNRDDYDRTLGALIVYDVLLINPIMDGMNLVAKEGPAVNRNAGALVLSQEAGAFEELGEYAVQIKDAHDIEETAGALEQALELDQSEKNRRQEKLRATVRASTPDDWINTQIRDLEQLKEKGRPETSL
ncbi:MAG: trehalose-6-phosphate synthase [Actinomycetota bacterium]|nr:trehalose-6-phosphate synthase [Actinomycetota bacterium]